MNDAIVIPPIETERTTKLISKNSIAFTYLPRYLFIYSKSRISTIRNVCISLARLILNSQLLAYELFSDSLILGYKFFPSSSFPLSNY